MDGNIAVHTGDAILDAQLYIRDMRRDYRVFRELYGIEPSLAVKHSKNVLESLVSKLPLILFYLGKDKNIIRLLNKYATAKARADKPMSLDVEGKFHDFCLVLEEGPCTDD